MSWGVRAGGVGAGGSEGRSRCDDRLFSVLQEQHKRGLLRTAGTEDLFRTVSRRHGGGSAAAAASGAAAASTAGAKVAADGGPGGGEAVASAVAPAAAEPGGSATAAAGPTGAEQGAAGVGPPAGGGAGGPSSIAKVRTTRLSPSSHKRP